MKIVLGAIIGLFLFSACKVPRSFYNSGVEPIFSPDSTKLSFSVSVSNFSHAKVGANISIARKFVFQSSIFGSPAMHVIDLSSIYCLSKKRFMAFGGPAFEAQRNHKSYGIPSSTALFYKYDCEYHSFGFLTGISVSSRSYRRMHQFNYRFLYNLVLNYNVAYHYDDRSAFRGSSQNPGRDEDIHTRIMDFRSHEIGYCYLKKSMRNGWYRLQINCLFVKPKTYSPDKRPTYNNLIYYQYPFGGYHPLTFRTSVMFGYIYNIPDRRKRTS